MTLVHYIKTVNHPFYKNIDLLIFLYFLIFFCVFPTSHLGGPYAIGKVLLLLANLLQQLNTTDI